MSDQVVHRISERPIVEDKSVPGYGAIFNAGLIFFDGRYHLFARGIRDGYSRGPEGGPRFVDYFSDILVFTSVDGDHYDFAYVLAKAGESGVSCFEDPRVQRVVSRGVEHTIMTYTDLPDPGSDMPHHIGAHYLHYDNGQFSTSGTPSRYLGPPGVPNKDSVIFNLSDGRVAFIHRVHPNMQLAIFDDLEQLWDASNDYWDEYMSKLGTYTLLEPTDGALGIGAGAPPFLTKDGLLMFFHERQADGAYTINLALLDQHTGRLVSRLPEPLMVPELEWELHGDVDNVVFVQGCYSDGDNVYLTYGAADSNVGAARTTVNALLSALHSPVEELDPIAGADEEERG